MHALLIAAALAAALLTGCAAVVVGGAAATGVVVAEDRRTVGTMAEDESIELKALSRIGDRVKDAHVNVTSFNRLVLLTGEVPDANAKAMAEKAARAVENVRGVFNELQIAGNSSLTARSNDSYLTSKVKARFVDGAKFNALHVKVVTESNVVYLLGMVKKQEAQDATEIARTTGGVQRVVRVFEFID